MVGYQRGVLIDAATLHVFDAQSKMRVCSKPVPASAVPPPPFFERGAADDDELSTREPGLERGEQRGGQAGCARERPGGLGSSGGRW